VENNNKSHSSDRVNFQHLRYNGYRFQVAPWLLVYWRVTDTKKVRILWNLSRKVSHSVIRNKLKRWCREFIRIQLKDIWSIKGLDVNFVFKLQKKDFYKELRSEEVHRELFKFDKRIRDSLGKSP